MTDRTYLTKPTAVIVDVDGTLCEISSALHHVMQRPKDFHAFHSAAAECPPIESTVLWVVDQIAAGHEPIIVTARSEQWRIETEHWLRRHLPLGYLGPMMRADRDFRPDREIKLEILDRITRFYDVVGAIDDNPAIVELWREQGIETTVVPGWVTDEDWLTHPLNQAAKGKAIS